MSKFIKMYGERNTNTNYLSKLIQLNLNVQEISGIVPGYIMNLQRVLPGNELVRDIYFNYSYGKVLGWKHTCCKPVDVLKKYDIVNGDLAILTITKNPYSWLHSLYRNPYHQYYREKPDFETFLQQPWKTVGRDNTNPLLNNPIELWNIKNSSYVQLSELNALSITTESIFDDPKKVIDTISNQFSINKTSEEFVNQERSTKDKSKDSNYYRDYYLKEKWREYLSSNAIDIINKTVDKELMSYYGYRILS